MFILFFILFASSVYAQEVDCSNYEQQVQDFTNEINNASANLDKAQANLDKCQAVNNTVASEDYKDAVKAIQEAKDLKAEAVGVNWNDIEAIK